MVCGQFKLPFLGPDAFMALFLIGSLLGQFKVGRLRLNGFQVPLGGSIDRRKPEVKEVMPYKQEPGDLCKPGAGGAPVITTALARNGGGD